MSNTRSAIRSLVDTSTDLTHLAERLNTRVFDDSGDSGVFVSGVIGCYDPANRQLAFVNCGHPEPLILRRDGRLERIAAGSAPLGMTHPLGASVVSTSLGAGDLVCLYTDGLVEASNACGEMFATERLEQRLQVAAGDSLDEMSSDILTAVQGFHGGPALDDDFTLVLLRGINRV
jgi:sigma-B regulation protein RsbU (phosphoserine phosphatase)